MLFRSSKRYFAAQFENVYGYSLDDEWGKWISWEHVWQRSNLDSIHRYPTTPYRRITQRALGSVSRTSYDSTRRRFDTAMNLPGQFPAIVGVYGGVVETGFLRVGDQAGATD